MIPDQSRSPDVAGGVYPRVAPAAPTELPGTPSRSLIPSHLGRPLVIAVEAATFFASWEAITAWFELVNPIFLPPPSRIAVAAADMITSGVLQSELATTLATWSIGFAIASGLGVGIGFLMGIFYPVRRLVGPIAWSLYSTPNIALRPLFVAWLGFGIAPNIGLVIIAAVWPILLATSAGTSTVDVGLVRAGRVFGASSWALQRKVLIPATLPFIVTGMRLAMPASLIVLVVSEILGGSVGLGGIIAVATARLHMADAFAALVTLVVTSMTLLSVFATLESRLAPWRADAHKATG